MSRHGYSYDSEGIGLWRGAVRSAIRGRRGQAFLRELRDALDAMPKKELIRDHFQDATGRVCALGCVGVARGLDLQSIDYEDRELVAKAFDIAEALAAEIEYHNDEFACWEYRIVTPKQRWSYMRTWVESQIVERQEVAGG